MSDGRKYKEQIVGFLGIKHSRNNNIKGESMPKQYLMGSFDVYLEKL